LSVVDEGHGLPDTFPSPEGTGLGLRLVQTYSGFGRDALSVDRSVPYSKIDVRFRL
jgi:two-component sensor histidine kinase